MKLNWKKIFLVTGFIAAVLAIGYLLYFFFLKPAIPSPNQPNGNTNQQGGLLPSAGGNVNIKVGTNAGVLPPGASVNGSQLGPGPAPSAENNPSLLANGGLTTTKALTTLPSYGATLDKDGTGILYYDKSTGQFFRLASDGKKQLLTDKVFYDVQNVTWSPNKDRAVLEYPDGAKITYDFTLKKQFTLPNHWKDFSFSPSGDQIVFKSMGDDANNRWLAISKFDGSAAQKIELLGDKDATVYPAWSPNQQMVAMFTEGKGAYDQSLYFVGLNNENFKSVTLPGRGFEGSWSTKGDRLLYSVWSDQTDSKPMLWIVSAQGENIGLNRRSLNLETWADKCTFADNNNIYCAVPQNLEEGAGILPNDLDNSACDIYKIDLTTGFKSKIATPQNNLNIDNLIVSEDGRYLYFNGSDDGRLYQINLK